MSYADINDTRERFRISLILASGVQHFPDMGEEELVRLGLSITKSKGIRHLPVIMSSDGILLDGHQRLQAMLANGRTYINREEMAWMPNVNRANAHEWSVRFNGELRRHLTIHQKARAARSVQQATNVSQNTLAEWFGVTPAAISQWFRTLDPNDRASEVTGKDGKTQSVESKVPEIKNTPRPKITPAPWDLHRGEAFALVEKLTKRLQSHEWRLTPDAGLTQFEHDKAIDLLINLMEAIHIALVNGGSEVNDVAIEWTPETETFGGKPKPSKKLATQPEHLPY